MTSIKAPSAHRGNRLMGHLPGADFPGDVDPGVHPVGRRGLSRCATDCDRGSPVTENSLNQVRSCTVNARFTGETGHCRQRLRST
jgi:hypothetical protein